MRRRSVPWVVVALIAMLAVACGGATGSGADQGELPAHTFNQFIYWVPGINSLRLAEPPSDRIRGIFLDTIAANDPRHLPFLIDLAGTPNPYQLLVFEHLKERTGRADVGHPFEIESLFGPKTVEDDTDPFLSFKHRHFVTLQQELGDFLDPDLPRTISAQEVFWGGVIVDGIPALEQPAFISAAEAEAWLTPEERVIGVEINGDARAYPLRIIDWHEMVNDTVGGRPVVLAYCTLCGSAILYDAQVGGTVQRFGTSGLLYRSNKLMYDRGTRTLWNQFTGVPVWGTLAGAGIRLATLPLVQTTWAEWRAGHPDSAVLSLETGYTREYLPGAAYGEYFASAETLFPVATHEGPLADKDEVFVVRMGEEVRAYPLSRLAEGPVHDVVGGLAIVVFAAGGAGGRAYASLGETFISVDAVAGVARSEAGDRWALSEGALVGPDGRKGERVPGHTAFWFAVVNQDGPEALFAS